jgi:hypothetical protein
LGALGDPADELILCRIKKQQGRRGLLRGAVSICGLNNDPAYVLIAGRPAISPSSKNWKERQEMVFKKAVFCASMLALVATATFAIGPARAQSADTTFFITSVGLGDGANLGGLAGADRHCQALAQGTGATKRTWHAYLSTQASDGQPAVNARDRIGAGPWQNSKGVVIAKDVAELHSANNNLTKQTALTEKGEVNNGRGDTPNRHDVLTGSKPDGTAFPSENDRTCKNWTSSTQGAAMVGHSDRMGLRDDDASRSWNSSHPSRGPDGGCSQADLRSTGGDGLFYCFALN